MRTYWPVLYPTAICLIAVYWFSTFVILGDAPLLDGPQDEADRAMGFFIRRTAISLFLLVALFVLQRLTRPRPVGKPGKVDPSLLD
jgi:hypothetical protein